MGKSNQTFTVMFFVKKNWRNDNGHGHVYQRITINGEQAAFSINRIVPLISWDVRKGLIKPKFKETEEVNSFIEVTYTNGSANITSESQEKYRDYGGIAVGAQAAAGTDFVLNDRFTLFGEIQADGITYSPKHGKYTEFKQNGTDLLGTRTVNQNEWNYMKVVDNSKRIPGDQPSEQIKHSYQFGNVGLVIGLKINL